MFTQEDIQVANKTSRANGAVGANAITPKYVRELLDNGTDDNHDCTKEDITVLDFGAGKTAAHAQALLAAGYQVLAYEFGDNVDPRVHCELALLNKYDVVYASNVLNVQSSVDMARTTIKQIRDVMKYDAVFIANYPQSPRKSDITPMEMMKLLEEHFYVIRCGGTPSAPLFQCEFENAYEQDVK